VGLFKREIGRFALAMIFVVKCFDHASALGTSAAKLDNQVTTIYAYFPIFVGGALNQSELDHFGNVSSKHFTHGRWFEDIICDCDGESGFKVETG
jgi:hypothetical protein